MKAPRYVLAWEEFCPNGVWMRRKTTTPMKDTEIERLYHRMLAGKDGLSTRNVAVEEAALTVEDAFALAGVDYSAAMRGEWRKA